MTVMPLERRKPLDKRGAAERLERELNSGVKVKTTAKRGGATEDSVQTDLGGLHVAEEHVETDEK
jgi:hypothetical protein